MEGNSEQAAPHQQNHTDQHDQIQWQPVATQDSHSECSAIQDNNTNMMENSSSANKLVLVSQTRPLPNPYCRKRPQPSDGEAVQRTTMQIQHETGIQHIPFPNLNATQSQTQ